MMIRINDRRDPQQPSTVLEGAQLVDTSDPMRRTFFAPSPSEFTSRLMSTPSPADRFNVAIGNPEAPEGEVPDVWYGVVESFQPSGANILVTARVARSVEEGIH